MQTALLSSLPEAHFCVVHSFAPDAVQSLAGDTAKEGGEPLLVPCAGTALGTEEQFELQDVRSEGSYWKQSIEHKDIRLFGVFHEVSRLGSCPLHPRTLPTVEALLMVVAVMGVQ